VTILKMSEPPAYNRCRCVPVRFAAKRGTLVCRSGMALVIARMARECGPQPKNAQVALGSFQALRMYTWPEPGKDSQAARCPVQQQGQRDSGRRRAASARGAIPGRDRKTIGKGRPAAWARRGQRRTAWRRRHHQSRPCARYGASWCKPPSAVLRRDSPTGFNCFK